MRSLLELLAVVVACLGVEAMFSGSEIAFDAEHKPGVSNLLDIQSALCGKPVAEIVESYRGKQYGHLKMDTAAMVIEKLQPIQTRTQELLSDRGELMRILKVGADKAKEHAARTLERVYTRIGFVR